MPIPATNQATAAKSNLSSSKAAGRIAHAVAKPILNAALLDGIVPHRLRTGQRMSKALAASRMQAVRIWQRLARYGTSIIRNPRDRFDGRLPEFFGVAENVKVEQGWREMTGEELEEAGFAYGEHIEVLEMQGMKLMGWVAEDSEEVSETMKV